MAHVFFSYAQADEALRNEFEKHLARLLRQGVITTWHDRRIAPGESLHGQIDDQLLSADIVLLLASADFLDPDRTAFNAEFAGEHQVIPIAKSNDSYPSH
jgi:hypothetical protein